MSFYEPQGWQAPVSQASMDHSQTSARSSASSASQSRQDGHAFAAQFQEVDRAVDNLFKSGKIFTASSRRDALPPMPSGRPYGDHGMLNGISPRPPLDVNSSHSPSASNLQSFYATQRYQGRPNDAEQAVQAKRRMAAQRERELRNYHQEQQYNRSVMAEMSSTQSDRSMSPSSVSEEGRRDLLARQHRALYGGSANNFLPQGGFGDDSAISREPGLQGPGTGTNGARGTSPRSTDPFAAGQSTNHQSAASNERTSSSLPNSEAGRVEASSSPASGGPSMHLGSIDASMEPPSARSGSPVEGGSPNHRVAKLHAAPIGSEKVSAGSRMAQQQHQHQPVSSSQQQQPSQSSIMQQSNPAPSQTITKRSTTPLTSPLNSFGLSASEQATHNERSGSTSSNPSNGSKETGSAMGAWGSGNGVWGSNKIGPASVWG